MAKGKRETEWEVIRLKATPAAFVGLDQAPDKAAALKAAIERFNIRREDQSRLLIRAEMKRGRQLRRPLWEESNGMV